MTTQQKHLARIAARRRRNKALTVMARKPYPTPRMAAKKVARDEYLDQVELDKLNGLENGAVCRKVYREQQKKTQENRARDDVQRSTKRKPLRRAADTYRGVRVNALRGSRRSLFFKAERLRSGETRSDADRRRHKARMEHVR